MNKLAIITAFLGEVRNRYMQYQGSRTLAEKLEMASRVKGLDWSYAIPPTSRIRRN
jgi:hypothetical protein